MARLSRVVVPGDPHHLTQRGVTSTESCVNDALVVMHEKIPGRDLTKRRGNMPRKNPL